MTGSYSFRAGDAPDAAVWVGLLGQPEGSAIGPAPRVTVIASPVCRRVGSLQRETDADLALQGETVARRLCARCRGRRLV